VMTNGRPYKEAMNAEEVASEFKRCAGKQFDPDLVQILLSFNFFSELENQWQQ